MTATPPVWTREQLDNDSQKAIEHFASGRHTEPLELYGSLFEEYQGAVEDFLEQTVDLTQLDDGTALALLSDARMKEVFRYITGPPISEDDLKTLMGPGVTLSPARLKRDGTITFRT